jgi:hypothetical protein
MYILEHVCHCILFLLREIKMLFPWRTNGTNFDSCSLPAICTQKMEAVQLEEQKPEADMTIYSSIYHIWVAEQLRRLQINRTRH